MVVSDIWNVEPLDKKEWSKKEWHEDEPIDPADLASPWEVEDENDDTWDDEE